MNPSETDRGKAWLGNFSEDEQVAARLLLDGLDLVGADRLRADLHLKIEALAATLPSPIALVPVRAVDGGQSYHPLHSRDSRPQLLPSTSFPGSEALIGNLAASLRRGSENDGPFVAAPSLRNMRAARCRTVLFVEDFSGSGDRILAFDKAFRRHPTIRSWLSRKWIDVHVVAFAATSDATRRLVRHFGADRVHVHRMCPTFADRPWTGEERQAVEKLCRDHYVETGKAGAYGYGNSRGMMAFVHSVPNNLPPILWQAGRRVGHGWRSFFENQAVPSDLFTLFGDASPEQRAERTLMLLGQRRLAAGGWRAVAGAQTTRILLVLSALSRRPASIARVMSLTGMAHSEVKAVVEASRAWGLVGTTLRLTDAGLNELKHAKRFPLRDEIIPLHGSHEPYYPRSLRVGR
ncbi:hypothetical protein [Sphingomonas sp. PP-CC-3G-468]|uniref:phosphoribosyltransferase-like protein n=1 Tax=Sphingomonas sp. PP-CC-3G-468 TaxID=2135656 RepID=UPI0010536BAF|nr:hypothetical protein [Sphingomonas sp. PP-CC-3G-468]TCM07449.1 hypothetical protein C8J41_103357 [Sphingomonas sp. PP-CC-3G-468]